MKEEISLKYEVKEKKIQIFGENFVKNNKEKCIFVFNNKEYDIIQFFEIPDCEINKNIEIKLKVLINNIDISYFFSGCISLLSISDNFSNIDISNSTNMNSLFVIAHL